MEIIGGIKLEGTPYYHQDRFWGSPFNYLDEIRSKFPERTYIHDVTLRDGEQTSGVFFKEDERIYLAQALDEIGVRKIEIGMPIISKRISKAMKKIAQLNLKAELVSLARADRKDIDATLDCGIRSIIVEFPMNPYLGKYAYGVDPDRIIEKVVSAISYAKEQGLRTAYEPWDCWRVTPEFMKKILTGVIEQAHPDLVIMTDTFSVGIPHTIELTFKKLKEWFPNTILEFHTHNDFGLGTSQALSALAGGADGVHSAFNGIGERSGNVPTEEIVTALEILLGVRTGVDLSKLTKVSRMVEEITKHRISSRKAVVGPRLFELETGVGIDFMKKLGREGINPIYPFSPEIVGQKPIYFVLGKGSGRASIKHFLDEVRIEATKEEIDQILEQVKDTSEVLKSPVSEETFLEIVSRIKKKSLK